MNKMLVFSAVAFLSIAAAIASITEASAYVCARGPYRAGCAGPRGAVGVRRGYYGGGGAVVVRRPYGYRGGGVVVRRRYY